MSVRVRETERPDAIYRAVFSQVSLHLARSAAPGNRIRRTGRLATATPLTCANAQVGGANLSRRGAGRARTVHNTQHYRPAARGMLLICVNLRSLGERHAASVAALSFFFRARAPPCKSERTACEGPGRGDETATDLRKRVSEGARGYPCVSVSHGLETDSRTRLSPSHFARPRSPYSPVLFFCSFRRSRAAVSSAPPSPWQKGDARSPLQSLESRSAPRVHR